MFEAALSLTVVTISSRSRLITGSLAANGNWNDSSGRVITGSHDVFTVPQRHGNRSQDGRR
jgi:hypothetical protein